LYRRHAAAELREGHGRRAVAEISSTIEEFRGGASVVPFDSLLGLIAHAALAVGVIAASLVRGPQMDGVPTTGLYGLIPVDEHGRVFGLPDAYAIGDATDYPVKQAAIACQQADAAAESVAARCGLDIVPAPFRPELRATLLTGTGKPLLLNGGQGSAKLPGRHLGPFLAARAGVPAQPG